MTVYQWKIPRRLSKRVLWVILVAAGFTFIVAKRFGLWSVAHVKYPVHPFLRNTSTLGHYALDEGAKPILETTLSGHGATHGFTVFNQLYARNGVFYIVTENSSTFPPRINMMEIDLKSGKMDTELRFIFPSQANTILGSHMIPIDGVTVIITDPAESFQNSYFHWWGEVILGFWTVYASMGLYHGFTTEGLPLPDRFILPNAFDWRDDRMLNAPLMHAAFPTSSIQDKAYWMDQTRLHASVVYEHAILISRKSAFHHLLTQKYKHMLGSTLELGVPAGYWESLRNRTVRYILGRIPERTSVPVVTYISRQKSGVKTFRQDDHERLVEALHELETEGVAEVHAPESLDHLPLEEQISIVSRTTIMIGIHDNLLTHEPWMPSSPQSTVIEVINPQRFHYDYGIISRSLGHKHFIVWNDTILNLDMNPQLAPSDKDERFNNRPIPIHIPTLISLVREQL